MDLSKPRVVWGGSNWWVRIPARGWCRQSTWERAIDLALRWSAEHRPWPDTPKEA